MSNKVAKRYTFAGLQIAVENPAGSERVWQGDAGVERKTVMRHDYGFIEGQDGKDGDEVDVYIGPNHNARFAYVVHQLQRPGYDAHDEDKVFLGFDSEAEAKGAFLAHRDDGEAAYGGMSAIPIGEFVRKLDRREGSGKIHHEAPLPDPSALAAIAERRALELVGLDGLKHAAVHIGRSAQLLDIGIVGQVRASVWDRGATFGEKIKNGVYTDFSVTTFGQFMDNWLKRGERISLCYNHQSAYVEQNGQPAPALAQYDAMAIVSGGKIVRFEKLHASGAQPPSAAELAAQVAQLATDLDPAPTADGLWLFRCAVTDLGQKLLPAFSYISPMFTSNGADEQGNPQGYTLIDLAATNTAFQAGCVITFDRASRPTTNQGGSIMAAKLAKMSKFVKFDEGADDKTIKAAILQKMEEDKKASFEDEGFNYEEAAAHLEEMAKNYEDAQMEEEDKDATPPHVQMRKYAAKYRKMAKGDAGGEDKPTTAEGDKPHEEPDGDEAYERAARPRLVAMAQRLGIEVKQTHSAKQLFDAISAAAVPASQIGAMVKEQVAHALLERDRVTKEVDAKKSAEALVKAADKAGYPKENQASLLRYATGDIDGARAMVTRFIGDDNPEAQALLFERFTAGGAPLGAETRQASTPAAAGPDRKVYENQLATFVVEGEEYSKLAAQWADATEGPIKLEIDAMLSDYERKHPGLRMIAADKLLRKKRPEMFQAQRGVLFGL